MKDQEFARRLEAMTETLFRVCYAQLPRACDREDAVQECLLRAWRSRGQLLEERYMQTWVCRILLNVCHDVQRREQNAAVPVEPFEMGLYAPPAPAPEGADPDVHDALMALDVELRLPLVLHYLEGFKIGEIAQMMEVSVGTVKSRMWRGRLMLGEKLKDAKGYLDERYAC